MHLQRNIMACSHNHRDRGNAAIRSVYSSPTYVSQQYKNNKQFPRKRNSTFPLCCQQQRNVQCCHGNARMPYSPLLSSYEIFRIAVNNINMRKYSRAVPDIFVRC